VAKQCEIGPKLLLITNKSHIGFQMARKSLTWMILEDHNPLWYAKRAVLWLNGKY